MYGLTALIQWDLQNKKTFGLAMIVEIYRVVTTFGLKEIYVRNAMKKSKSVNFKKNFTFI